MTRFRFSLAGLMSLPVFVALLCVLYRGRTYLDALPLIIPVIGLIGIICDRGSWRPFLVGFTILGMVYPVVRMWLLFSTPGAGLALMDRFIATVYLGRPPRGFEPYGSKGWEYFHAGGHVVSAFVIACVGGLIFALTRLKQHQQEA